MNEGIYEVSVSELFKSILKKWWIVAVALILGALLMFAYTEYLVVPTYKTTARLGVHTTDDTTTAVGDASVTLSRVTVRTLLPVTLCWATRQTSLMHMHSPRITV